MFFVAFSESSESQIGVVQKQVQRFDPCASAWLRVRFHIWLLMRLRCVFVALLPLLVCEHITATKLLRFFRIVKEYVHIVGLKGQDTWYTAAWCSER